MSVETRLNLDDIVEIGRQFRLQWEQVQQAYVLLYPEGMVKLSQSAGEILKRIDGKLPIADVVKNLEQSFPGADPVCDLSPHHHIITEAVAKAQQARIKPATTHPILFRDDKNSRALSESAAARP